jgi:hypothetical protein
MPTAINTSNSNAESEMTVRTWKLALPCAALACMWIASAATARGQDPVAACIAANERALDLRKQGKLVEARRELTSCAVSACPDVIQQACAKRINEINGALPSIVLDVENGRGQPVAGAQVSIDGASLVSVGATSVPVDPGPHALHFVVQGQAPVDMTISLLEGEKDKRIVAVIGPRGPGKDRDAARLVVSSDAAATIEVDGRAVARERIDSELAAGLHDVQVTEAGKLPYKAQIDLREGETRVLSISLEDERRGGPIWPWIAGGIAVAAGAAVGGYLLFKPQDQTQDVPPGKTAAIQLSLSNR